MKNKKDDQQRSAISRRKFLSNSIKTAAGTAIIAGFPIHCAFQRIWEKCAR